MAAQGLDPADDFVAGDEGEPGLGQFAVNDVQVGPADGAGVDADQDLAVAGAGDGEIGRGQGCRFSSEQHRTH